MSNKEPFTKDEFNSTMKQVDNRMATFVTKNEFNSTMKQVDNRMATFVTKDEFNSTMKQVDNRMATFVTKNEFYDSIRRLEEKMYTKEDHTKYMVWLDEAMTELRDMREDRVLSGHQIARLDDSVFDHEKRINNLEKKVLCAK